MQSSLQIQVEVLANAPYEHILELLILKNIELLVAEGLLTLIGTFHHLMLLK